MAPEMGPQRRPGYSLFFYRNLCHDASLKILRGTPRVGAGRGEQARPEFHADIAI